VWKGDHFIFSNSHYDVTYTSLHNATLIEPLDSISDETSFRSVEGLIHNTEVVTITPLNALTRHGTLGGPVDNSATTNTSLRAS